VEVVETGLESDSENKTGYALSKMISMGKLKAELESKGYNETSIDRILKLENEEVKVLFGLEEVYAPSKIQMDTTLHYLKVTIPKNKDIIDSQYFWEQGKSEECRLINIR